MFSLTSSMSYYMYNGTADMRKTFDGFMRACDGEIQP